MQILIIKTSSLGDLFRAIPTVHLLKTGLGADVDWVVNSEYSELVECFCDVRRVVPFPRHGFFKGLSGFLKDLRVEEYDLVVDLQGLLKSAWITRAARSTKAAKIIGPSFQREGARFFYDAVAAPKNKNRHAVDECLDVLRYLGLPDAPVEFPVEFPEYNFGTDKKKIVLAPCSRWEAKNWPIERFIEAGNQLVATFDAQIHVVGGPSDIAACQILADGLPSESVINLAGKTSLCVLGGVVQGADLFIGVDSGPTHLAAATATPVLAIFGPTDPVRVGPYGAQHRVLRDPSLGSVDRNYSKSDMESIRKISVQQVVDAAAELLGV